MAVGKTLNDFKSKMNNLAKPNRFLAEININDVIGISMPNDYQYYVRSTKTPEKTIGSIDNLYWQGTQNTIGGDPTYDDITLTFVNRDNFEIIETFEKWQDFVAGTANNVRNKPNDYKGTITLIQLNADNSIGAKYICHGVFPTEISPIDLSHETNDAVEEFTVTFKYDFFANEDVNGEGTVQLSV